MFLENALNAWVRKENQILSIGSSVHFLSAFSHILKPILPCIQSCPSNFVFKNIYATEKYIRVGEKFKIVTDYIRRNIPCPMVKYAYFEVFQDVLKTIATGIGLKLAIPYVGLLLFVSDY